MQGLHRLHLCLARAETFASMGLFTGNRKKVVSKVYQRCTKQKQESTANRQIRILFDLLVRMQQLSLLRFDLRAPAELERH